MSAPRRLPGPWTVHETEGAFIVRDANGQALSYHYFRETEHDAAIAKVLTRDEARRVAMNVAKLPDLVTKA